MRGWPRRAARRTFSIGMSGLPVPTTGASQIGTYALTQSRSFYFH